MLYVYTYVLFFNKMKTQTEYISVIRLINTPINTKISLKKNFILLLCILFSFFSLRVSKSGGRFTFMFKRKVYSVFLPKREGVQ